jgi:diacylglycerol kinase (ATP)
VPRACVVRNPKAGRALDGADLLRLLQPLEEDGWQICVKTTSPPEQDATALTREAVADGCDVVIAVGGDGTINEVIQALTGTDTALGVLPVGTGNVWAREVGIPSDLRRAVTVLREGWLRRVDVGMAGERFFLLMAGVGYDALVTRNTGSDSKRKLGILAYLVSGITVAVSFVGRRVTLEIDGVKRQVRALLVVVGNTRLYGVVVSVTSEARIDDGLLDVCVFRGTGLLQGIIHAFFVLLGRHLHDPGVSYFRASKITVHSDPPLLVQVDGDTIGSTPMTFSVRPRALKVIVPRIASQDLFGEGEPVDRIVGREHT